MAFQMRNWAVGLSVAALVLGAMNQAVNGQSADGGKVEVSRSDERANDSNAMGNSKTNSVVSLRPTLRLPRYFAGLIDDNQRAEIQKIQLQFSDKIAQLEGELKLLKEEELLALENVLTEQQRKLLVKKRQQPRGKRPPKSVMPASELEAVLDADPKVSSAKDIEADQENSSQSDANVRSADER